jgi:hypothetical protein
MARIPGVDFSSSGIRLGTLSCDGCDVLFRPSGASGTFDLSLGSSSLVRTAVPMQAKDGKGGTSVRTITAK